MRTVLRVNAVGAAGLGALLLCMAPEAELGSTGTRGGAARAAPGAGADGPLPSDVNASEAPAPVADAAQRNDLAALLALLQDGADVNAAQGDGMTGLHWAAHHGGAEMARVLIEAGANVEAVTRVGDYTPLHVASKGGNAAVVEALLEAGSGVSAMTTAGVTPLHLAAGAGNADAVASLLRHGADPNGKETIWGQTPLMFAAAADRADAVRALLRGGADHTVTATVFDLAARDLDDRAAQQRHRERVRAERSGQPWPAEGAERTATPTDAQRREAASQLPDPAEALRRGGEPVPLGYADLVGSHGGLTALLLAARDGNTAAALALVEGGADINQVSAGDHTSPMLIAMINGHFDLAMELFERGADSELASDAGATPLYAVINTHWIPKSRHPQPVHYRQQRLTYLEVMERLLQSGVDPNPRLKKTLWYTTYNRDLLGVDRTGATPFWRAAHALDLQAMRLLVAHGADPHLPTTVVPSRRRGPEPDADPSGLPPAEIGGPAVYPVHAASGVGHGQGFAGNSHRHVPNGWLSAVKYLVEELGADPHVRDHNGYNAVHHAAARGDNELIHYLVELGVSVKEVSRRGQTTVDMANGPVQRVQPYPETIALLESLGAVNNHRCVSC